MGRKPIVGGNWKCNPVSVKDLDALVANINLCDTTDCDVYVCPSPLHMGIVYKQFKETINVAPQNCNFKGCGAYTGEMSADQMADMGLKWCLIGHSERRGEFGLPTPAESSALIAETKMGYLLEKDLNVILAIGEPKEVREKGIDAVMEVCKENLSPGLALMKQYGASRIVIAYEPVWSIGTGLTASPKEAQDTHKAIRDWLKEAVSEEFAAAVRIQYGGSANAKNAKELSEQPDVDGFLVGGASLKPEFADIVKIIGEVKK